MDCLFFFQWIRTTSVYLHAACFSVFSLPLP